MRNPIKKIKIDIKERPNISRSRRIIALLLGLLLAFGIGGLLILSLGKNPLVAYQALFLGSFGSTQKLVATVVDATPLLLVALGLSIAFKSGFWNIGSDGQYIAGILLAAWIGINAGGIPSVLVIPLMLLVGFIGGGVLALVSGILKVKRGIGEVFTTLMFNFLMIFLAQFLVGGPWQRPGSPYPETSLIAKSAFFPKLIPGTAFHLGDLIGFIFVIIVYFLIFRTTIGFKIRAIGSNPNASALKGLSVNKILLLSVFLSGGLAGLAGVSQLGGVYQRVTYETVLLGVGYVGILITFLGRSHPIWITVASFFFGVLVVGGENMTMVIGVPTSFTMVLQILILLLILLMDRLAQYEIKIRRLL